MSISQSLQIDEQFKIFLEELDKGKFENPLDVPIEIWRSHAWELLDKKRKEGIFLPWIRWGVKRAKEHIPVYKKGYERIDPNNIQTIEDFWNVPPLVKDATIHGVGFRGKVLENPYVMCPDDVVSAHIYRSGGTRGVATPTFITNLDELIESEAFARGLEYEGMKTGSRALITYNPSHKGGVELNESALLAAGLRHADEIYLYENESLFRKYRKGTGKVGMMTLIGRTTDTPKDLIETIQKYHINVLITVQGPIVEGDKQQKGAGVDLRSLVSAGQDVLEKNIEILFLGGYRLLDYGMEWSKMYNKPLVTLLGSCEAIPQASNTNITPVNRFCTGNNLHVLHGPHYIEVLKNESGVFVPSEREKSGLLAYTTLARLGTLYVRYFPGDAATLYKYSGECSCPIKSEIINEVHRVDIPADVVQTGCCIGGG